MKKRERSEVEYLRGLVRDLKSQNRHLKKLAGRSVKRLQEEAEPTTEDYAEEEERLTVSDACPKCQKSGFKPIKLGSIRSIYICHECGHRKSEKNST